ncbi:MAG: glycosyltransferase family 4 protein [Chthoniobacterales bacterium]
MKAFYFRIGEFSLINVALLEALRERMSGVDWREVDVEREIVRSDGWLTARATGEAMVRHGARIFGGRIPPRDFFPRLPVVLRAIAAWSRREADEADFTFQTQSLFDASSPGVPHFVYTDHTYLAGRRYPEPRELMPVAAEWRAMERRLYEGADCTFVSSEFAAGSVREDYGVESERVMNVGSGSNVDWPEFVDGSDRRGTVILFVGVDWERKGGPELVRAFREVRSAVPGAELWIVGCRPGLSEDGVVERGRLSREETAECYRKADVFCLPSRMDPSASVLAEAAGSGLPVVATAVGGNVERVRDGATGFLVDAGRLAERLRTLLMDAELRKRMGAAGREMAMREFTWTAVAGRIAARIEAELISREGAKARRV